MTQSEFLEQVAQHPANKVEIAIPDIDGVLRGKVIHKQKYLSVLENGQVTLYPAQGRLSDVLDRAQATALANCLRGSWRVLGCKSVFKIYAPRPQRRSRIISAAGRSRWCSMYQTARPVFLRRKRFERADRSPCYG